MNSKIILSLSGLAIFLSGCNLIAKLAGNQPPQEPTSQDTSQLSPDVPASITGSLADLMSRQTPMTCQWNQITEAGNFSGTVFVDGVNMRANMKGPNPSGDGQANFFMIADNEFIYSWSSLIQTGTKIKKTASNVPQNTDSQPTTQQDLSEELDMVCKPWSSDSSTFQLPTDIDFQDLSQILPQTGATNPVSDQSLCELCKQLPQGEAQDQCLASC